MIIHLQNEVAPTGEKLFVNIFREGPDHADSIEAMEMIADASFGQASQLKPGMADSNRIMGIATALSMAIDKLLGTLDTKDEFIKRFIEEMRETLPTNNEPSNGRKE